MNFNVEDLGVIGALMGAGFGAVLYMVRVESKALKTELSFLKSRLDKMDTILDRLANFQGKIDVLEERFTQQGKRQDEIDRRINDMSNRLTKTAEIAAGIR